MKRNLNFIEAGSLLETNETTSVDLTKIYLEKIKEAEKLNCFNTVSAEQALDEAEKKLSTGKGNLTNQAKELQDMGAKSKKVLSDFDKD